MMNAAAAAAAPPSASPPLPRTKGGMTDDSHCAATQADKLGRLCAGRGSLDSQRAGGAGGDLRDLRGQHSRGGGRQDRKSTRLNSSHLGISYAVFCLKKKKRANV